MPKREVEQRIDSRYQSKSTGNRIVGSGTATPIAGGGSGGGGLEIHTLDGPFHSGTLSWSNLNLTNSDITDLGVTGSQYDVVGLPSADNTLGITTPSSDGTAGNNLLITDANGKIKLADLEIEATGGVDPTILFDDGSNTASIYIDASANEFKLSASGNVFFGYDTSASELFLKEPLQTTEIMRSTGMSAGADEQGIFLNYDTGYAEAWDLSVQNLRAEKFIAGVSLARIGAVTIGMSAAHLAQREGLEADGQTAADFTIPAKGSTTTMYVRNLPGVGDYQAFQQYERVLVRFVDISDGYANGEAVFRITSTVDTSSAPGFQKFTVDHMDVSYNSAGNAGQTIPDETPVIGLSADSNANTGGFWEASTLRTASSGGPFSRIVEMDSPNSTTFTLTEVMRIGFLGGLDEIGGGTHSTSDLGLHFNDPSGTAAVELSTNAQRMQDIDFELYESGDKFLYIDPSSGIGIVPTDTFRSARGYTFETNSGLDFAGMRGSYDDSAGIEAYNLEVATRRASGSDYGSSMDIYTDANTGEISRLWIDAKVNGSTKNYVHLNDATDSGWLTVSSSTKIRMISPATETTDGYFHVADDEGMRLGETSGGDWKFVVDGSNNLEIQDANNSDYQQAEFVTSATLPEVSFINGSHRFAVPGAIIQGNSGLLVSSVKADTFGDFSDQDAQLYVTAQGLSNTGGLTTIGNAEFKRFAWIAFNAYHRDGLSNDAPFGNSDTFKFHAGNTSTSAGAMAYNGADNEFRWDASGQGYADGANITDWTKAMTLSSAGELQPLVAGENWQTVTYDADWQTQSGEDAVQYKKFGDLVFITGTAGDVDGTSGSGPHLLFTLPSGYRPPFNMRFACVGLVNNGTEDLYFVSIDTSGNVNWHTDTAGNVNWISLTGVVFSVD